MHLPLICLAANPVILMQGLHPVLFPQGGWNYAPQALMVNMYPAPVLAWCAAIWWCSTGLMLFVSQRLMRGARVENGKSDKSSQSTVSESPTRPNQASQLSSWSRLLHARASRFAVMLTLTGLLWGRIQRVIMSERLGIGPLWWCCSRSRC